MQNEGGADASLAFWKTAAGAGLGTRGTEGGVEPWAHTAGSECRDARVLAAPAPAPPTSSAYTGVPHLLGSDLVVFQLSGIPRVPQTSSAHGQVSVFYRDHVSMVNRFLRIPKGQTVSPTAERGASGCLMFESVKNKDNTDIWGCNVTESQSFKGKNHFSTLHAIFSVLFTCLIGLKYLAPFKILIVNLYCKM